MKIAYSLAIFIFPVILLNAQPEIVNLYDGNPPGSESWIWKEKELYMESINLKLVYNVSKPTLTAFPADPEVANGTAIIICPGGAFQFLSIESEGFEVARWLNQKGVTAFVLKYRLTQSLTDSPMQELMEKQPNSEKFNEEIRPIVAFAIADGKMAITYVRTHASEYGISPDRIGIIGFSAGGTVATGVAYTYDRENRPDYVVPVYPYVGSFEKPGVPPDAPPMFIVAASDDMFGFQDHCVRLYEEWSKAGKSVEMHLYARGDHGFGMNKKNLPVDTWIERFADWLQMLGYVK